MNTTMNTTTTQSTNHGQRFLSAVERLLRSNEEIHDIVWEERQKGPGASERIVSRFSNQSAVAGALAGAPSLVPGWGLLGAAGMMMVEMTYVMKFEVEMCLALAAHHGLDIRRRENRQLAFLLAAVGTSEEMTGRDPLLDLGASSLEAVWNYSPREISKLVLHVFGVVALVQASQSVGKGLLRAIPVVGVGVGAGVNKVLTRRVGLRAIRALRLRPSEPRSSPPEAGNPSL
jgi:hypothetical protein